MPLTSGLLAYWKLDDASGTSAADATGNGHTGTLLNSAGWGTGKINGCLAINAGGTLNQSVDVAAIASGSFSGSASVSAWGNQSASNGWAKIFSWLDDDSTAATGISLYANDLNKMRAFAQGKSAVDPNTITNSSWIHWVATYDGTTVTLYRNGSSVASTGGGSSMTVPTHKMGIGNCGSNSLNYSTVEGFKGSVDEVGLWNRALSSGEVSQLYNSGNGLAYPFTVSSAVFRRGLSPIGTRTGSRQRMAG